MFQIRYLFFLCSFTWQVVLEPTSPIFLRPILRALRCILCHPLDSQQLPMQPILPQYRRRATFEQTQASWSPPQRLGQPIRFELPRRNITTRFQVSLKMRSTGIIIRKGRSLIGYPNPIHRFFPIIHSLGGFFQHSNPPLPPFSKGRNVNNSMMSSFCEDACWRLQ